jgi:hypothetical protein
LFLAETRKRGICRQNVVLHAPALRDRRNKPKIASLSSGNTAGSRVAENFKSRTAALE